MEEDTHCEHFTNCDICTKHCTMDYYENQLK